MIPIKTKIIIKHLAALLCMGCLISGCDRSDTESGLARGCFEPVSTPALNENLTYVAIPDSIVERELIKNGFDTDGLVNGRISIEDAKRVKQLVTINANVYANPEYSAKNLDGIEYFESLEIFGSVYDLIDSVDLAKNTKLRSANFQLDINSAGTGVPLDLRLSTRTLRYINIGKNENLRELRIINSVIKELDVSGLSNLETLEFAGDSLKIIYIKDKNQIKPDWNISFSQSVGGLNDIFQYKVCEKYK